jgi:filamentous hemagglutinin family protein
MKSEREVFMKAFRNPVRICLIVALLLSWGAGVKAAPPAVHFAIPSPVGAQALPQNPSVAFGNASFNTQGSQLTINTSDRAFINWGSFNIGADASTTFVQPSASSVVWNHINDPNASQILGHLDANGLVILQNSSGFYVGGQAAINTGGLVMTTSPTVPLDLSSGGAWQFNAPPPTASIINYGQINSIGGGPVFLIAHDIENQGSITAPGGSIGLYAGKEVLVSERPDGRSLTAAVTLPQGSVDNSGRLIADGGNIALHAQVVNQGGLIQANSVRTGNGVIELVASDEVNLGAGSVIEAKGDTQGTSAGGSVMIKSDASFSDVAGSTIDVSGGAQGGNGGQVEISAPQMSAINSKIDGHAAAGSTGGKLLIDPDNILVSDGNTAQPPDTMLYDVNNDFLGMSAITLQANFNIELNTPWDLSLDAPAGTLTLLAGRNITLDDGSSITAPVNWAVNMTAGTELTSAANRVAGMDGIYLHGHSFIQTQNGNINLSAANEVLVDTGDIENVSDNGIRTLKGGSINVTTEFGDINSGGNSFGYLFSTAANFWTVSTRPNSHLGGISTAAGGDVSLTAGGDVISYLPLPLSPQQVVGGATLGDAGSGAFGRQPGNVTIKAGGSILGHYVVANGTGSLTAGVNVGDPSQGLALSLITGAWNVNAPNGSIYMQEVRNPNGTFNNKPTGPGYYFYDYDPHDSVSLDAGNLVDFIGANLPRTAPEANVLSVPLILYPPTLNITAGAGGVILNSDLTLFPSSFGELTINTPGDVIGNPSPNDLRPTLMMSDSNGHQWVNKNSFIADPGAIALELSNPDQTPQVFNIGGDVKTINFVTTRPTTVNVGGEMDNVGFNGENLRPGDITAINVTGRIFDRNVFTFEILTQGIQPIDPAIVANWNLFLNSAIPKDWTAIFALALDPTKAASFVVPSSDNTPQKLALDVQNLLLFQQGNPGFVYNPDTKRLGFQGVMPSSVRSEMEGTLEIVRLNANGLPVVDASGHFVTDKVSFVDTPEMESLYSASQDASPNNPPPPGFQIGGPGFFKITAASLDLGNSEGIESWGVGDRYASLVGIQSGAEIDVNLTGNANLHLTGDLSMISSRIASFDGGDVNVTSASGTLDLGSQEVLGSTSGLALGVYTTGHSDVNVNAFGDINIDGSRIAAYNGGSINVESTHGNVNIGSGGTGLVKVEVVQIDPITGQVVTPPIRQPIFGSGLVTTTLPVDFQSPGGSPVPGNITVNAPLGNISSSAAGVLQLALDGHVSSSSTVKLTAGTEPDPNVPGSGFLGNIDLGDGSGVIGGTVILNATGDIKGLVISSGNSTITAGQTFSGVNLSAGTSTVSASDISGTVIAIGGITASGVTAGATLLSQNVSVGGAASQSTLGTTATATSTATAAAASESNSGSDTNKLAFAQNEDDLKKGAGRPLLAKTTGRVTVILPPAR